MPQSILDVDSSFPDIRGKDQNRINQEVLDHLFMLNEQLRYTLANLGQENFNEKEFDDIVMLIRDPIYARIEDDEGRILQLSATAEGLISRVEDVNGNVSTLSQTVLGMRLEVSNGYGSSTLSLTANGAAISSEVISFTGIVTFDDLSTPGTTTISGDNIKTGTIKAIDIESCRFRSILKANGEVNGRMDFCYLSAANIAATIRLDDQGAGTQVEGRYRLFFGTYNVGGREFHMKLTSQAGISIEAGRDIYLWGAEGINIRGGLNLSGTPLDDYIANIVREVLAEGGAE